MGACRVCGGNTANTPINAYPVNPKLLGGIENVVLVGGSVSGDVCDKCKDTSNVTIPDLPGLIAAIALTRVKLPIKLRGQEIRFLRKAMDFSAVELGKDLEVAPETISRWETGERPIGPQYEKLLRLRAVFRLQHLAQAVRVNGDEIASMRIPAEIQSIGELPRSMPTMYFARVPLLLEKEDEEKPVWKNRKAA